MYCSAVVFATTPYGPPQASNNYHVRDRNCKVEFEEAETELCVPTLETKCSKEQVKFMVPEEAEKCITVTITNCKAEVQKVR